MSRANVEVVQRWIDAFNRRDIDGLIALTDPDIEFRSIFVAIERVFRGHEGIYAYIKELDEAFARFQVVPTEFTDAGAAVLVAAHFDWRGKESGAGGTRHVVPALWLKAGKVFRIETFTDRTLGCEAVGLSEDEASAVSSRAGDVRS
jgi:ketosteroid isomerase-like protein